MVGLQSYFRRGARYLRRNRSDGRLKTYKSCEDVRAWSQDKRERHSHLADYIASNYEGQGDGTPWGKHVPVPLLVDLIVDSCKRKLIELHSRVESLEDELQEVGKDKEVRSKKGVLEEQAVTQESISEYPEIKTKSEYESEDANLEGHLRSLSSEDTGFGENLKNDERNAQKLVEELDDLLETLENEISEGELLKDKMNWQDKVKGTELRRYDTIENQEYSSLNDKVHILSKRVSAIENSGKIGKDDEDEEIEKMGKKYIRTINELECKMEILEKRVCEEKNKNDALTDQLKGCFQQIDDFKRNFENKEENLNLLKQQLKCCENEKRIMESMLFKMDGTESTKKMKKADEADLEEQVISLQSDLESANKLLNENNDTIKSLNEIVCLMDTRVREREQEIQESEERYKKLLCEYQCFQQQCNYGNRSNAFSGDSSNSITEIILEIDVADFGSDIGSKMISFPSETLKDDSWLKKNVIFPEIGKGEILESGLLVSDIDKGKIKTDLLESKEYVRSDIDMKREELPPVTELEEKEQKHEAFAEETEKITDLGEHEMETLKTATEIIQEFESVKDKGSVDLDALQELKEPTDIKEIHIAGEQHLGEAAEELDVLEEAKETMGIKEEFQTEIYKDEYGLRKSSSSVEQKVIEEAKQEYESEVVKDDFFLEEFDVKQDVEEKIMKDEVFLEETEAAKKLKVQPKVELEPRMITDDFLEKVEASEPKASIDEQKVFETEIIKDDFLDESSQSQDIKPKTEVKQELGEKGLKDEIREGFVPELVADDFFLEEPETEHSKASLEVKKIKEGSFLGEPETSMQIEKQIKSVVNKDDLTTDESNIKRQREKLKDTEMVKDAYPIKEMKLSRESEQEEKATVSEGEQKVTPIRGGEKVTLSKQDEKVIPIKEEEKVTISEQDEKVIPIKEEEKGTVSKQDEKITVIKGGETATVRKQDEKVVPIKEEEKGTISEQDEKVIPIKEEEKVTISKQDEKVIPIKEEEKVTISEQDEKVIPIKEKEKVAVSKQDEKVIPIKEEEKVTVRKQDEKVIPIKEEEVTISEQDEKVIPIKEEEKGTVSKQDEKITVIKGGETATVRKQDEKVVPIKEEEKGTVSKQDEKITVIKEEEKVTVSKQDEKVMPIKDETVIVSKQDEKVIPIKEEEKVTTVSKQDEKVTPIKEEEKITVSKQELDIQLGKITIPKSDTDKHFLEEPKTSKDSEHHVDMTDKLHVLEPQAMNEEKKRLGADILVKPEDAVPVILAKEDKKPMQDKDGHSKETISFAKADQVVRLEKEKAPEEKQEAFNIEPRYEVESVGAISESVDSDFYTEDTISAIDPDDVGFDIMKTEYYNEELESIKESKPDEIKKEKEPLMKEPEIKIYLGQDAERDKTELKDIAQTQVKGQLGEVETKEDKVLLENIGDSNKSMLQTSQTITSSDTKTQSESSEINKDTKITPTIDDTNKDSNIAKNQDFEKKTLRSNGDQNLTTLTTMFDESGKEDKNTQTTDIPRLPEKFDHDFTGEDELARLKEENEKLNESLKNLEKEKQNNLSVIDSLTSQVDKLKKYKSDTFEPPMMKDDATATDPELYEVKEIWRGKDIDETSQADDILRDYKVKIQEAKERELQLQQQVKSLQELIEQLRKKLNEKSQINLQPATIQTEKIRESTVGPKDTKTLFSLEPSTTQTKKIIEPTVAPKDTKKKVAMTAFINTTKLQEQSYCTCSSSSKRKSHSTKTYDYRYKAEYTSTVERKAESTKSHTSRIKTKTLLKLQEYISKSFAAHYTKKTENKDLRERT